MKVEPLQMLEHEQKAHSWDFATFDDDEVQSTDLFLCLRDICVQKLKRNCAVQDGEKLTVRVERLRMLKHK